MTIFELCAFLGILSGAIAGYQFISPHHGVLFSLCGAAVGAGGGYLVGVAIALLFMLLLTATLRLGQFIIKRLKK